MRHHVLRSARRMSFLEAIVELAGRCRAGVGRCVGGWRWVVEDRVQHSDWAA